MTILRRLAVAVVAAVLLAAGAVQAAEWGTIAYSPSTGATGYSHNWPNEVDAEITALNGCGRHANDCVTAVNFYNSCGALAVGRNGGWGASWGNSRGQAENKALAQCSNYDGGCSIRRWQCSK